MRIDYQVAQCQSLSVGESLFKRSGFLIGSRVSHLIDFVSDDGADCLALAGGVAVTGLIRCRFFNAFGKEREREESIFFPFPLLPDHRHHLVEMSDGSGSSRKSSRLLHAVFHV